jgi:acyl carrier protein
LQIAHIESDRPLQEYGMDSIIAMRLAIRLERKIAHEIKPSLLIEFPTVDALSQHLQSVVKPILI